MRVQLHISSLLKGERMPSISVIVPVYNVEKYIHRCVDSILNQTYTDFELILVDDGSPDNCGAICDEYAQKDSRVVVIHQENGGLSAARNAGIDWAFANSNSEWLTFIDSDDWIHTEYLKFLYQATSVNRVDISVCGIRQVEDDIADELKINFSGVRFFTGKEGCAFIYTGSNRCVSYVSACTKLFSKKLFNTVRFPVGKIHEDQFTTYRLLFEVDRIAECGECAYFHYSNADSITKSKFNPKRYDDIAACEEAARFYLEQNEFQLADLCITHKRYLTALYSLMARKSGVYHSIPRNFRVTLSQAYDRIMKKNGMEYGEFIFYQYYPWYTKFRAYWRKISQLF